MINRIIVSFAALLAANPALAVGASPALGAANGGTGTTLGVGGTPFTATGATVAIAPSTRASWTQTPQDFGASVATGSDDSAAINAAITAASAFKGGAVYFPPGVYNICASTINLPAGTNDFEMYGKGATIQVLPTCATPPASVITESSGAQRSQVIKLHDLVIDGYCLASNDLNVSYARDFNSYDVIYRNVATGGANIYIASGGEITFQGGRTENLNDSGHECYSSNAALPSYGVYEGTNDSHYQNFSIIDAAIGFENSNGGDNHVYGMHVWGYTSDPVDSVDLRPQIGFETTGSIDLQQWVADTVTGEAVHIQHAGSGYDNALVYNGAILGGLPNTVSGVVIESGVTRSLVFGNNLCDVSSANSASASVVQNGSASTTTFSWGNNCTTYDTGAPPLGTLSVTGTAHLGNASGNDFVDVIPSVGSGVTFAVRSPNSSAPFYLSGKGNAAFSLQSNGATAFSAYNGSSSVVNYLQSQGNVTGFGATLNAVGSDANINLRLNPKGTGVVQALASIEVPSYIVSTLPSCSSSIAGSIAYVTDAASPTYNATLSGGSSTKTLAMCNGASWTAH